MLCVTVTWLNCYVVYYGVLSCAVLCIVFGLRAVVLRCVGVLYDMML